MVFKLGWVWFYAVVLVACGFVLVGCLCLGFCVCFT